MGSLDGRVAVVTGASRGIGKEIALWLGREGAAVVCTARSTDAAPAKLPGTIDETVREIETAGGRGLAVACDVRDEHAVAAVRQATRDAFGPCDLLVNNAGISFPGNTLDLPVKRWDLVVDVNLRGPYLMCQAFAPGMVEQGGGTIINISSAAAVVVGAGRLSYSVTKAALDKLSVGLAAELQPHAVHVISIGLELPVLTDGFVYVNPDADTSGWEPVAIMGEATLWVANHAAAYNGRVVTIADLRQDYARGAPPPR